MNIPPDSQAPRGRDEVRAAIIAAARQRFAREGLSASLRDIAADAGVNLGLVHRHFGSKDAVVRAAFSEAAEHGRQEVASAETFAEGARRLLSRAASGDDTYARMLALLLLDARNDLAVQDEFPTIARLQVLAGGEQRPLVLLLFLSVLGWPVFGPHLSGALGYPLAEDAQRDLQALLERLIAAKA